MQILLYFLKSNKWKIIFLYGVLSPLSSKWLFLDDTEHNLTSCYPTERTTNEKWKGYRFWEKPYSSFSADFFMQHKGKDGTVERNNPFYKEWLSSESCSASDLPYNKCRKSSRDSPCQRRRMTWWTFFLLGSLSSGKNILREGDVEYCFLHLVYSSR